MSNKAVEIEFLLREGVVEGIKKIQHQSRELEADRIRTEKAITAAMKKEIEEQKGYIKGLQKEMNDAIKYRDNKGLSGSALSAANRDISEMRNRVAKEQVLLQGMQERLTAANKDQEQSQGGLIASLGKWALGIATVTGAMKLGKAIIDSTEETGHKFEQAITAATSATGFFFKTIASGDWSNFNEGIKTAIDGAVEYVDRMEKVNNMKNQDLITSAKFDKEIADALEQTYDRSKENRPNALAGISKAIKKTKEKYDPLIETAKEERDTGFDKASSDTGGKIKSDEIKTFLEQYRSLENMLEMGKKYNEAVNYTPKVSSTGYVSESETKKVEGYRKEIERLGEAGKTAGENVSKISLITPETRRSLAQLDAQVIHLQAQQEASNKLLKRREGTLTEQIKQDEEAAAKKAKEDAELDSRIKKTQELMQTASGKELDNLAKKLVLLKKEKKIRDDLINQAIMRASDDKSALLPLDINFSEMTARSGGKVTSKLALKIDSEKAQNDLVDTTKKFVEGSIKQGKKLSEEEIKRLEEQRRKRVEILNAAMDLTYELAKQVGLGEDQLAMLNESLNAISLLAQGNYAQAAVSAAMAISDGLAKLITSSGETERAKSIEKINDLLKEQIDLVAKASREGGEAEKRKAELSTLKEKETQLNKNKNEAEAKLQSLNNKWYLWAAGGFVGLLGILKSRKKLQSEISATKEEIDQLETDIKVAEQELLDFQSQGITQNKLADSITKAFEDGKGTVKNFGDYTNDILREAVLNAFKANVLGDSLTNAQKLIAAAFDDKTLTAEEIKAIRESMQTASQEAKSKWDALTSAFPEMYSGADTGKGRTADIKSITEETATVLSGDVSSIRFNVSKLLENGTNSMTMLQESLEFQQRTADNTDSMKKSLDNIDNRLLKLELDGIKVK